MNRQRLKPSLLRAFWPYVQPYRWVLGGALLILLIDTLSSLAAPWPVKLIFDNVLLHKHLQHFWIKLIPEALAQNRLGFFAVLCAILFLLAILSALSTYFGMRLLSLTGQRVIFRLRCTLFQHLQQMSPSFYDRQRMGDLLTRLTSDVQAIQDLLVLALPMLLLSLLIVGSIIVFLLILNPEFGLLGLLISLGIFLVLRMFLLSIKGIARQMRRQEGQANTIVQESLLGIRVLQAFGMEAQYQQRYTENVSHILQLGKRAAHLQSGLPSLVNLMTDLGTVLVLGIGGLLVLHGWITIGDLLVFSAYLTALYKPLRQLSKFSTMLTRASASSERVLNLLHTQSDLIEQPDASIAPPLKEAITFSGVRFGYTLQRPALQDITFQVRKGTIVALVGHTGAGKSSILHLLQRFYDPQVGSIRLDGQDLRSFTLASLRQQIALVPQEPMLFHASIRENIAYGRIGATDKEISAAAEAANADEFIRRLPEGYDTVLGERGIGLSGGERQRIAIARAMIKQAPLLLLDEPTVGLDAYSEERVVQALERLMIGRTTVVSAHRFSTIQRADLIIVFEQGRIVEMGSAAELLTLHGCYYRLFTLQFPLGSSRHDDFSSFRPMDSAGSMGTNSSS